MSTQEERSLPLSYSGQTIQYCGIDRSFCGSIISFMSSLFVVSQQFIVFADEPITGNSECYFKILGLVSWGEGVTQRSPQSHSTADQLLKLNTKT